jgi:acyl-CoA thioesterase
VPPVFSRVDTPMAVPTIDLTVHFRGRPADPFDPLLVVFDSPLAQDGYMVEHGRVLDRTGRLIAESRQLAVLA